MVNQFFWHVAKKMNCKIILKTAHIVNIKAKRWSVVVCHLKRKLIKGEVCWVLREKKVMKTADLYIITPIFEREPKLKLWRAISKERELFSLFSIFKNKVVIFQEVAFTFFFLI